MIWGGVNTPCSKVWSMRSMRYQLQQVTFCLWVGKGRVKETVELSLRNPKANLLQVNGVKAISHTPDRDRVLPRVPEGTGEREGARQQERKGEGRHSWKGRKKERKGANKTRGMKHEHSGQRMTIACFDSNACCSLWESLTEGELERQHFVFLC